MGLIQVLLPSTLYLERSPSAPPMGRACGLIAQSQQRRGNQFSLAVSACRRESLTQQA